MSEVNVAPSPRERVAVAVIAAVACVGIFALGASSESYRSDWDQVWHGSRAILAGVDPYTVVGRGMAFDYGFPLYYPLPSLVAMLPLALLPLPAARLVFVGLSAGLLTYAVMRDGVHRLWILASGSFFAAVASVQWSPLLTAAFLLPWLAPVVVMKPNIGAALTAATPERRFYAAGLIGGGGVVLLSFALDPQWVSRWLGALQGAPHFTPPVLLWGGPIILVALSRWRRPEARLLLAMACVPHTTVAYEALPLLLVAKNWRESILLAALSLGVLISQFVLDTRIYMDAPGATAAFENWVRTVGTLSVALLYLPATIMVLRRPNEGQVPAWLTFLQIRTTSVESQSAP